jgi:hypothetical protein
MFLTTALLYPCVLVALCVGTGLLVDRFSGGFLPVSLLACVGAAALIGLSQLTTYVHGLAPATPYAMAAVAAGGFWLGRGRARSLLAGVRTHALAVLAALLAYVVALAPVLMAGRASFSSYMALADSAVHMIGADYLIRHGQDYAHLDLRNSYGQFIHAYYGTSYPSGADTLLGGSALLLGRPLIWAFQPFNALMLALIVGPAWLLVRRLGLNGAWAALAALSATVPALVYAYELLGSVKEITALPLLLTLGCLVAIHGSWLRGPPARAIPFALVLAAGFSALGTAFAAWGLAAAIVLGVALIRGQGSREARARRTVALVAVAAATLLIAAWPTWSDLGGALQVAQNIASTSNPGNLSAPLNASHVLGVWLDGSYKLSPSGAALTATDVLAAITLLAAVLGAVHVMRRRAYALAGWLALMLLAWLAVTQFVTTWGGAKTLMLTSPVVVLMAWGGVAALRGLPSRWIAGPSAALLALALGGGALASDALQYHASNLAPTRRYEELSALASRFAGQGPTLFTDFDEWSLYELRDLDVGGPDFAYPPAALAAAAAGYGDPVDLDRLAPSALRAYPLIVTRRDPAAERPPAAYELVWQRSYYQVWRRRPHAATALKHVALSGRRAAQCREIKRVATAGRHPRAHLVVAQAPELIAISLAHASHPKDWGRQRKALVMKRPGTLEATFRVPAVGIWEVWVKGQIMPTVALSVDGRPLASLVGQLGGNSLVIDSAPPIPVLLRAGVHRLALTRTAHELRPGDGGAAVLGAILLTRASQPSGGVLRRVPVAHWRRLCGRRYEWVELIPGRGRVPRRT